MFLEGTGVRLEGHLSLVPHDVNVMPRLHQEAGYTSTRALVVHS